METLWLWAVMLDAVACAVICYMLARWKGYQGSSGAVAGLFLGPLGVLWAGFVPDLLLRESIARAGWRRSLCAFVETGDAVHLAAAAAQMPGDTRAAFLRDMQSDAVRAQVLAVLQERIAVSPMSVAD